MWAYNCSNELYHHGVKGMKWGVRRYQYADGSLTPSGKKRNDADSIKSLASIKVKDVVNSARTQVTGRQYVDGYLNKGTTFARIQTSKEFEGSFAFFASYNKADINKYMGLFGKNLRTRSEREANASGDENKIAESKNLKVYQVKLGTTKKLKIPSDENAGDITSKLLREKEFKDNVVASIQDSKEKMKRPTQQILFNQAQKALGKDPNKMTSAEKIAIYKALNLSLTNHNQQEIAAQNRLYGELSKKGYNALLDYNDKDYSSYHAKRPMIVFDTNSVILQSITETNPKMVDKMYTKYNTERIAKETITNTFGLVSRYGQKTVSECSSYLDTRMDEYLNS